MNRPELGNRVAERTGLGPSAAKDAVDAVFAVIADALAKGEDVRIAGFGAFGTRKRAARTGRNPRTGGTRGRAEACRLQRRLRRRSRRESR